MQGNIEHFYAPPHNFRVFWDVIERLVPDWDHFVCYLMLLVSYGINGELQIIVYSMLSSE